MNFVERNATWQMMQLSCPSPFLTHLINTPTSFTNNTTTNNNNNTTTLKKTASLFSSEMDHQRLIINNNNNNNKTTTTHDHHHDHLSIFISTHDNPHLNTTNCVISSQIEDQDFSNICSSSSEDSQTLELFPLRSGNEVLIAEKEPISVSAMNTPCQFFEFLPLKN